MRSPLVLLAPVLAACVTATAGASPSYPIVSHSIKVEFRIGIEVEWTSDTGSRRTEPCGTWAHQEGSYEVTAGSIGKLPPGRKAGSFIHPYQNRYRIRDWAILYAAGQARVRMTRRLSQKGQTNACGDYPAEPTKFPPNDCGERRYTSRHAFIRPDWRDSFGTMEEILSPLKELRMTSLLAISIDAPAQQLLYRRCDVPAASFPTGVQNVGVPLVRGTTLRKLRSMKIGQTVGIVFAPASKANCMRSLPPGETCKFSVVIQVDITRVKPPSGR